MFILLIGLFLPFAHSASTCTSASGDVDGFNACVASALGSGGADDPKSACAGNTGDSYNVCMCAAAGLVVKCYNDHCAGDAGLRGAVGVQANHCNVKATTAAELSTEAFSAMTTDLYQTSEDFVTSSLVFSESFLITIPSNTFAYPMTTVVAGINMNDLPPFPDSGAMKDHILAAIALSAVTILMLFA